MELLILNFHENLQKDYFFSRKRMLFSMQISFCKYTRETNIRCNTRRRIACIMFFVHVKIQTATRKEWFCWKI